MCKILLALIFCLVCSVASAETLWVSKTGAGDHSGSSLANAINTWANVQWGTGAGKVSAGDTLYIVGELTELCTVGLSGTAGNPIIIRGDSAGTAGSINGNGLSTSDIGLLYGSGKSYITVENLTIKNAPHRGIQFDGAASNITVQGVTLNHTYEFGTIFTTITNAVITDSGLYDVSYASNGGEAIRFENSTGEAARNTVGHCGNSGVDLFGSTNNVLVHDNTIYDLYGTASANAYYIDSWTTINASVQNNKIYNNTAYNSNYGYCVAVWAEQGGQANGNYVYNNLCYSNAGGIGIGLAGLGTSTASTNTYVYNNTFLSGGKAVNFNAFQVYGQATNTTSKNNIFYDTDSVIQIQSGGQTGLVMDYDIIRMSDGTNQVGDYLGTYPSIATFCSSYGQECHGFNADPLFSGTYTLLDGSLAATAGTDLHAIFLTDRAGVTRTVPWSMGAYEYTSVPPRSVRVDRNNDKIMKNWIIFLALLVPTVVLADGDMNNGGIFNKGLLVCDGAGLNCAKAKQINAQAGITDNLDGSVYLKGGSGGSSLSGLHSGYVSKATSGSTIADSAIYENGGNVGIGTDSPQAKLDVEGDVDASGFGLLNLGQITGVVTAGDDTPSYDENSYNFHLSHSSIVPGSIGGTGTDGTISDDGLGTITDSVYGAIAYIYYDTGFVQDTTEWYKAVTYITYNYNSPVLVDANVNVGASDSLKINNFYGQNSLQGHISTDLNKSPLLVKDEAGNVVISVVDGADSYGVQTNTMLTINNWYPAGNSQGGYLAFAQEGTTVGTFLAGQISGSDTGGFFAQRIKGTSSSNFYDPIITWADGVLLGNDYNNIPTAQPTASLTVKNRLYTTNPNVKIIKHASQTKDLMQFLDTNGTTVLDVIDVNGNVGIGSTVPRGALDVNGVIYGNGTNLTGVLHSYTETSTLDNILGRGNTSTKAITVGTTGTGALTVTGAATVSGNVGVGSTSPRVKLDVEGVAYFGSNVGIGTIAPTSTVEATNVTQSKLTGITTAKISGLTQIGIGTGVNVGIGSESPGAILTIPTLKSTTGTRYLCIDTVGNISSSASACSGT